MKVAHPRIIKQRADFEIRRPGVNDPDSRGNRWYLSNRSRSPFIAQILSTSPVLGRCARLVEFGAVRVRLLRADENYEQRLVMQDVEGN